MALRMVEEDCEAADEEDAEDVVVAGITEDGGVVLAAVVVVVGSAVSWSSISVPVSAVTGMLDTAMPALPRTAHPSLAPPAGADAGGVPVIAADDDDDDGPDTTASDDKEAFVAQGAAGACGAAVVDAVALKDS